MASQSVNFADRYRRHANIALIFPNHYALDMRDSKKAKINETESFENVILWNKVRGNIFRSVRYSNDQQIAWLDSEEIQNEEYYNHDYRKQYFKGQKASIVSNHISMKDLQGERIDLIREYIGSQESLLEIGCSSGYFLEAISDICPNSLGVECNESEVSYGKGLGLQILHGGLEVVSDVYNHICLFQVLEHQQYPEEFLSSISSFLSNARGFLHIEVPTLENPLISLYQSNDFRDFWFQTPHKYYYTKHSLTSLVSRLGFRICNVSLRQRASLANHFNWFYNRQPMLDKKSSIDPYSQLEFANDILLDNAIVREEVLALLNELDKTYKSKLEDLGFGDTLFITCQKLSP